VELVELGQTACAFIVLAIIVSSVISSVTGMAGGILMFTSMGVYIPMNPLIAIHGTVQLFANASRCWFLRRALLPAMCLPFAIGAIIGAAVTTVFIARYLTELIPLLILCLLIGYTLFKPSRMPDLRIRDKNFFWVGIATGSLGIIAGAVDPLLAAFFLRDDLAKEEVVANKSMMQLVTHLTKIPAFVYLGFAFREHLGMLALFSVAGIGGTWLGVYLLGHVNTRLFFKLMRAALFLAGLRVIYQIVTH
jgi:uncharacterized membrane protein YfcA